VTPTPLSLVPLLLPRSSMVKPEATRVIRAWRREAVASQVKAMSQVSSRPTTVTFGPSGYSRPKSSISRAWAGEMTL